MLKSIVMVSVFAVFLAAHAPSAAADLLVVVTTIPDLKCIAEAVGGDLVKATSISGGNEDPHFIQAKPSYMMIAHKADLWIRVGLELEIGYESLILDGARNPKIRIGQPGHLDASEGVMLLEVPTERVTRDMGDVHPMGNPHYWLDPLNVRIIAKHIADRLAKLDPAHADTFQKNCKAFQEELDRRVFGPDLVKEVGGDALWTQEIKGNLDAFLKGRGLAAKLGGWMGRLKRFAGTKIVTYHRSWVYLTHRFGLEVAIELEPKPGIPPSPAHLAKVVDLVKADHIRVILQEPFYERKAADFVASKTGATVIVSANSVGGEKEATDYFTMIDLVVSRLAAALGAPAAAK